MTGLEMVKMVAAVREQYRYEYDCIGVRFSSRAHAVGDTIDHVSKSNPGRDMESDFPVYGSAEYSSMDDLDGVSAYNAEHTDGWDPKNCKDVKNYYEQPHCYMIGSNDYEIGEDLNEVILADAKVLAVIF